MPHCLPVRLCQWSGPAAKSRNQGLLQQLLQHHVTAHSSEVFVFPDHWFKGCEGYTFLRSDLTCCYAALASGDLQAVQQLLLWGRNLTKGWRSTLLLRCASRQSNAECLQLILTARRAYATYHENARGCLVAPQHLQVAAGRTDPWAAGGQCSF